MISIEDGGIVMRKQILKTVGVMTLVGIFMTGCAGANAGTEMQNNNAGTGTTQTTTSSTTQTTQSGNGGTTTNTNNSGEQSGTITEEKAKKIAMEHAGVKESDITTSKVKQDRDDGILIYEVKFFTADKKYEYDIKADDGKVLKVDYETISGQNNTGKQITEDEAKKIALEKVDGATQDDIFLTMDTDDGKVLYEGDIIYGDQEYEFEIDAYTGDIVKWEAGSVFD